LDARESLEEALSEYDGTIVTVSHDRFFLDRIAGRMMAFGDGPTPRQFGGNYTQYKEKRAAEARQAKKDAQATKAPPPPKPAKPEPVKVTAPVPAKSQQPQPGKPQGNRPKPKKKHTFEQLEQKIMETELKIKKLEAD